jgi:hypothetical protein
MFYKLDEHKNAVECTLNEWAAMFETTDRYIGNDVVNGKHISTVFIGIDRGGIPNTPLLYETMVFDEGGSDDNYCQFSYTYEEALLTHESVVNRVQGGEIE